MKTVIIWDWDGTIINSAPITKRALQDMAKKYNQPDITDADVFEVNHNFKAFWVQAFKDDFKQPVLYFLDRLQFYNQQMQLEIFPGILPTLEWIKQQNITQLVVSNKPQHLLDDECDKAHLRSYFARVVGRKLDTYEQKPDVTYGHRALQGINYDTLIVIGDGIQDMTFARNLGAKAWYVSPRKITNIPYDRYFFRHTDILSALKERFRT